MKKSEIVFIENIINISTKYRSYTNSYKHIINNLNIENKSENFQNLKICKIFLIC